MTSLLVAAAGSDVLAAASTDQNNFGDTRSGALAGPLGLVFILLLGLATVLLIRNMNSRIRRLPESFDQKGADGGEPSPGDTAEGAGEPESAGPEESGSGSGGDRERA
jgi:hypothetical protein